MDPRPLLNPFSKLISLFLYLCSLMPNPSFPSLCLAMPKRVGVNEHPLSFCLSCVSPSISCPFYLSLLAPSISPCCRFLFPNFRSEMFLFPFVFLFHMDFTLIVYYPFVLVSVSSDSIIQTNPNMCLKESKRGKEKVNYLQTNLLLSTHLDLCFG